MGNKNYYETHKERFSYLNKQTQKYIKQEFDYLDSLDLTPIVEEAIEKHNDITWIMEVIEDVYGEDYEETFVFNYIDSSDFMNYLSEQYGCIPYNCSVYYIGRK